MIFPFPILFPSPYPYGVQVQVYDFKSLLAKIFWNKQCMEEFFQKNPCPNVDVVTVEDFDRDIVRVCHKTYYEEDEKFFVVTATFPFSKCKLPNEICKKLDEFKTDKEVDITEIIEAELDKFKNRSSIADKLVAVSARWIELKEKLKGTLNFFGREGQ